MEKTTKLTVALVTTDSYDNAHNIAKIIVSEHLAACCTIVQNCVSVFSWKDAIQESSECMMVIKTKEKNLAALEERILELHNYDVPEIIAMPVSQSHKPYLDWINNCLPGD